MSRSLSYVLILIGGIVAIYTRAGEQQNQLMLIGGIVILMLGVYSVSRNITSKSEDVYSNSEQDDISNNGES